MIYAGIIPYDSVPVDTREHLLWFSIVEDRTYVWRHGGWVMVAI